MRRSKFNLSHYHLTTGEMGQILPIGLTEVLPGDSLQVSSSALVRMSPMAAPVMHPIEVAIHHFFVPHRLTWTGWEDFITGGPTGNDASTIPRHSAGTVVKGSILNRYGVPAGAEAERYNRLASIGHEMIFNEYYRDQDLVPERTDASSYATVTPHRAAWRKDYFTSSRPWTQKGDDVTLPIGTVAPVIPEAQLASPTFYGSIGGTAENLVGATGADNNAHWQSNAMEGIAYWEDPQLVADLSKAEAINVNEFRRMFALQRYAEARARYGSRYTEYLRYLGIKPSDARLQRPEYVGGGRVSMSVSEILQTAPEGATPARDYGVGDLYGHGVGAVRTRKARRFFEEHGYLHSLMIVRPQPIYQNHSARHWLKRTKEEFYQKELMEIGQQAILAQEVYENPATWDATFGFSDRYQEYKENKSYISGDFSDTLNYWHLARDFTAEPVLNQSFVECVPSKRIFNEQTQDPLWIMCNHRIGARRLVKKSGHSRIL